MSIREAFDRTAYRVGFGRTMPPPGTMWCTRCGARPGVLRHRGDVLCRLCALIRRTSRPLTAAAPMPAAPQPLPVAGVVRSPAAQGGGRGERDERH